MGEFQAILGSQKGVSGLINGSLALSVTVGLGTSVNRLMVDALGFLGWHHAGALGSARRGSEGRRQSMHQPNDVQFATTQLSTGVRVHYAERGDRAGEAIIFLHGYSDS
jgi:hypothetical protein